jgi:hypothetical protein
MDGLLLGSVLQTFFVPRFKPRRKEKFLNQSWREELIDSFTVGLLG